MHEMSIADALLQGVLDAAAKSRLVRVQEVMLDVGKVRLVVPEALELAWTIVSEGTVAAGSLLRIREVPIEAACRRCGRVYPADVDNYLCPGCGQADVEIVAGDDIMLTSVVGEVEEQGAAADARGEPRRWTQTETDTGVNS
jgi:hydrogenase nickel incorporation protein HypA/HybF